MKLIKEICQDDSDTNCEKYELRKAVRTVLVNTDGKIALLSVSKHNYHKLAGGGLMTVKA